MQPVLQWSLARGEGDRVVCYRSKSLGDNVNGLAARGPGDFVFNTRVSLARSLGAGFGDLSRWRKGPKLHARLCITQAPNRKQALGGRTGSRGARLVLLELQYVFISKEEKELEYRQDSNRSQDSSSIFVRLENEHPPSCPARSMQ